jgi:hypothetical protein
LFGLISVGCGDGPSAPEVRPADTQPAFAISDAVFEHGNARFYWLPPIVAQPAYRGTPDPTLSPQVTICEWNDPAGRCGLVVADFTSSDGTGGQTVRYDATGGFYSVNWDTKSCVSGACSLDPAKVYRIRVFVGRSQLGFADVDPEQNGSTLKNVDTDQYVALVNGRTLPVKFRIEQGAVSVVRWWRPAARRPWAAQAEA